MSKNNRGYIFSIMKIKYGQRLKLAREHAGLSQAELAAKAGVGTQENISKLERTDADGSEFTVQYARACGVSPDWLASGKGEMIDGLFVHDPRIKTVVLLMQKMPEYAVDQAVKDVTSISELIKQAKSGTSDS